MIEPTAVDRWHFITGEYPPAPGGISDYCRVLAEALTAQGAEIDVWTGSTSAASNETTSIDTGRIRVHRQAGSWSNGDLNALNSRLDLQPAPRKLLVHYTPNAFGRKGMNIAFCDWLNGRRRRGDDVRILFHEVRYLERPRESIRRRVLALIQREMVRRLLKSASVVYVTVPFWDQLLSRFAPRRLRPLRTIWLPVSSNVPVVDDAIASAEHRRRIAPAGKFVVGSFGTFHDKIGEMVASIFPQLLGRQPDRVGVFIGRGGEALAEALRTRYPELSTRLVATGALSSEAISLSLRACDLMVQPYPAGICGKRTTAMAALAHEVPLVSTEGKMTEAIWQESQAVCLSPDDDLDHLIRRTERLIGSVDDRSRLVRAGGALYRSEFALPRLIRRLTLGDRENT